VEQLAPPQGVVVVVGETVTLDLTAATAAGSSVATTIAPTVSSTAGTTAQPATSDSP
jgi:hypothetical protein